MSEALTTAALCYYHVDAHEGMLRRGEAQRSCHRRTKCEMQENTLDLLANAARAGRKIAEENMITAPPHDDELIWAIEDRHASAGCWWRAC